MSKGRRNRQENRSGGKTRNASGNKSENSCDDENPHLEATADTRNTAADHEHTFKRFVVFMVVYVTVTILCYGVLYAAFPWVVFSPSELVEMAAAISKSSIERINYELIVPSGLIVLVCRNPLFFFNIVRSRNTWIVILSVIFLVIIGNCILWYAEYVKSQAQKV